MYFTNFIPFLIQHLRMCKPFSCNPVEFDQKSNKFILVTCPKTIRMYRLQCLLTLLYCTVMLLHLIYSPFTWPKRFQGSIFFIMNFILLCSRWNYGLDIAPIQVINSFVTFETTVLDSKFSLMDILNIWLNKNTLFYRRQKRKDEF